MLKPSALRLRLWLRYTIGREGEGAAAGPTEDTRATVAVVPTSTSIGGIAGGFLGTAPNFNLASEEAATALRGSAGTTPSAGEENAAEAAVERAEADAAAAGDGWGAVDPHDEHRTEDADDAVEAEGAMRELQLASDDDARSSASPEQHSVDSLPPPPPPLLMLTPIVELL